MDNQIKALFEELHSHPELSGNECETRSILHVFLSVNTDLALHDTGAWLYGVHHEGDNLETIAFRADMDAIKGNDGTPFHGCGHDGHMATMCALALEISSKKLGKNVVFIFQPSEEDGKGAVQIAPHLKELGINRIYGFHNIPGYRLGMPLLREGTFACASKGLTLHFAGRQSHAAYPETGANPAFAIAETVSAIDTILKSDRFSAMVLATIVNITVGEKNAFGVNAGQGSLSLTIRAEREADLDLLQKMLTETAEKACARDKISLSYEVFDEFPETYNAGEYYEKARENLERRGIGYEILPHPMRWSEDFGHYLKEVGGMFLGIGAGEHHAALHTENYEYDTGMIDKSVKILLSLL